MYHEIDIDDHSAAWPITLITGINLLLLLFVQISVASRSFNLAWRSSRTTLERCKPSMFFHFLVCVFQRSLAMAAVLGNTMFGALHRERVIDTDALLSSCFCCSIGATSFTEFSAGRIESGTSVDKFFRVFYCGLIPVLFQWVSL